MGMEDYTYRELLVDAVVLFNHIIRYGKDNPKEFLSSTFAIETWLDKADKVLYPMPENKE